MEYNFREIEEKWQQYWAKNKTFKADNLSSKPKYYVLDMFPYPSGAGLHVGHPLGYIASDIYARYKRHCGYNVLHPMGYDAFGLPAEQYAIQTGQHPAITTNQNIKRYREQLDKLGFSYDWDREVRTCDPDYYKWTQWIFIQLFNSWYNCKTQKAEPVSTLISIFEKEGYAGSANNVLTGDIEHTVLPFSVDVWKSMTHKEQQDTLMNFRLAYLADSWVNWCPALGTVLANDEVKDGVSERGGYPVERKLMKQWSMRITAYSERLLTDLNTLDWSESIKESQRYWIGKSKGSSLKFSIINHLEKTIEVFTTRPDTVFGVSFVTLAPEHLLVNQITTPEYKEAVKHYITYAKSRSERERMADVKKVTGQFTGAYAEHPFTKQPIPVWIGDYVLAGYGTGAVMAVPAHDSRDFNFAKTFNLPIKQVIEVPEGHDIEKQSYDAKEGKMINSDFINGLEVGEAMNKTIEEIEKNKIGRGKINYRLRDAVFGRQRYWGEPIPVYYKDGVPHTLPENELPLVLPEVDKFLPTETGEPPLARATNWKYKDEYSYETTTMPGWAGSSWYFLRYMDSKNNQTLVDKTIADYWRSVDLYIGGSEHATGHLLYVRFWTKALYDLGFISVKEPAQKLINQGMIQGRSNFVYRIVGTNTFVSNGLKAQHQTTALHVDVNMVENDVLNIEQFKQWREEYANAEFILENDKYVCGWEVEKMSKSKWNVQTPDDICDKYGADTLRLYEMFLGPLEQSKPWNINGITGVYGFLKKLWRLFYNTNGQLIITEEAVTKPELKALHKTIKKITDDIERYSFNTSVSNFMILVNELTDLGCHKKIILKDLLILLSPYAPHIAEELWQITGNTFSVSQAEWPVYNETYTIDDSFAYPISFNGKMRFNLEMPINLSISEIEKLVLEAEQTHKYLEGKQPKKIIIVPKKIVNVVI
ncbi:MAG: leucine--tRNA ligase [Bacteroidia bacterium]|nr:leucine--tRNA ligase [Bacteroidia bacterium]